MKQHRPYTYQWHESLNDWGSAILHLVFGPDCQLPSSTLLLILSAMLQSQHMRQKYQTCLWPLFSSLHQRNLCGWASGVMLYELCVISATKNKQHNHHFRTTCTAMNLQPGLVNTLNLAVAAQIVWVFTCSAALWAVRFFPGILSRAPSSAEPSAFTFRSFTSWFTNTKNFDS